MENEDFFKVVFAGLLILFVIGAFIKEEKNG